MKNLFVALALISLSGCASEVDKCVSAWEKANPGEGTYCAPDEVDPETNSCRDGTGNNRAQQIAKIRFACLQASQGQ